MELNPKTRVARIGPAVVISNDENDPGVAIHCADAGFAEIIAIAAQKDIEAQAADELVAEMVTEAGDR